MNPIRSVSSQLTTKLLNFRNPQGGEENWINGNERIPHSGVYWGKVIATEIGASLLVVVASIESLANLILFVGSLPLLAVSQRPFDFSQALLSSSSFTIIWNLGNLTVFNLFCTNVFTDESLARFSMDHWPRGSAFRVVMRTAMIGLTILSFSSSNPHYFESDSLYQSSLRPQDILYLIDWSEQRHVNIPRFSSENPTIFGQLREFFTEANGSIDEGSNFFKEFMLNSEQLDVETKRKILETVDAEVMLFVMTRAAYIYIFGSKMNEKIPLFFKHETRQCIDRLREKYMKAERNERKPLMQNLKPFYVKVEGKELESLMQNHKPFYVKVKEYVKVEGEKVESLMQNHKDFYVKVEGKELELLMQNLNSLVQNLESFNKEQEDTKIIATLNCLKEVAYDELQNSLFLTKCWPKAVSEYNILYP